MILPVLAFIEPCQSCRQDNLGSEGRFDKASEDRAVTYLWRNDFIDSE